MKMTRQMLRMQERKAKKAATRRLGVQRIKCSDCGQYHRYVKFGSKGHALCLDCAGAKINENGQEDAGAGKEPAAERRAD